MKLCGIAPRWMVVLLCVAAGHLLGGCATQGRVDPWEKWNRGCYKFNDGLDAVAFKPLADGYVKVVPKEVRRCVANGFKNLEYGDVILNDFLQGRLERGWSDSGRMLVNSTIGVAGIFDVATPMGMPEHENDFGVTLGRWGVPPGPYLVLPLFGPSSSRDWTAIPVGIATNPLTWIDQPWGLIISLEIIEAVDTRSRYEKAFKFRNNVALDPYVFTRDAYLQNRQAKIDEDRKQPPTTRPSIYDEPEEEPETPPSTQSAAPASGPASSKL